MPPARKRRLLTADDRHGGAGPATRAQQDNGIGESLEDDVPLTAAARQAPTPRKKLRKVQDPAADGAQPQRRDGRAPRAAAAGRTPAAGLQAFSVHVAQCLSVAGHVMTFPMVAAACCVPWQLAIKEVACIATCWPVLAGAGRCSAAVMFACAAGLSAVHGPGLALLHEAVPAFVWSSHVWKSAMCNDGESGVAPAQASRSVWRSISSGSAASLKASGPSTSKSTSSLEVPPYPHIQ